MTTAETRRSDPPGSELNKQDVKTGVDTWYAGMFSGFFVPPTGPAEDRNCDDVATRSEDEEVDSNLINAQESRDDIEDDTSTVQESLASIGSGFGDDLKSVSSLGDGSIEASVGTLSLAKTEKPFTAQFSLRSNIKKESVETVVEKKIHNLKSEPSDEAREIPYLRRKLYPKTTGRKNEVIKAEKVEPSSVLETRRHMLVKELREAVETHGRFDVRCANITAGLGDLYEENREYTQALRLHKDVVSVFSTKLGDDNEMTLKARIRLGEVQENAGDFDDAVATYYYVISMMKALQGETAPEAAEIMTKMAGALQKKGKHELAVKTLKRALKVYREVLGDSHLKVSMTVEEIAKLYVTMGDFSKASAILEEVVKLKAATGSIESNDVADSLSDLASCYECAEQYSKAMQNLKRAYKIYADAHGESGEKSILSLERIALNYQATGQFKKAAIAYLGVLRGRKRAFGEYHPTVADTYYHLGISLRESGQEEKSFKCMKQALNIYVCEGKDMHDVEMIAEVMHELAVLLRTSNEVGEAIKTFKQEIAVRRKLNQAEYPSIAKSLNLLGLSEFELKNQSRALNHLKDARLIYEKAEKTEGIEYAEVLFNLGLVYQSLRKKQRGQQSFLEAAIIFKKNGFKSDQPRLSEAVAMLKQMGHKCECKGTSCSSVPCDSLLSNGDTKE
eukprot:scaffold2783_cov129-Cylindrotheca_fusiformis.AAC.15